MPTSPVSSFPFLRPPVAPDEIGRLGEYRVLRLLNQGGMGFIFKAEDIALLRPTALKVLKPTLVEEAKALQRFLREARTLAAVRHENVVLVYGAGQEGNVVYLAMELLAGQSLSDLLKSGRRLRLDEVIRLAREVAGGLAAMHRQGLIHRDIKPSNIWVEEPHGRVKILDFGLVTLSNDDEHITQSGLIIGTPAFMSPEQARGEAVDGRSDLFSLGCVLYNLCTGREPFPAESAMGRLTALATINPPAVRDLNPAIPQALSDLVARLLKKERDLRPGSADELIDSLKGIEEGETIPALSQPVSDTRSLRRPGGTQRRTKAPPSARLRWWHWALLGIALLGIALLGIVALAGAAFLVGMAFLPPPQSIQPDQIYLADLPPLSSVDWPMGAPPGRPPPPNPFVVMSVDGKRFPHGVGMHASGRGEASVSYSLGKKYDVLAAGVSLNDTSPRSPVPLTFSVYGDGRLLWRSDPVTMRSETQNFTVSVKDVDVLQLAVTTVAGPPEHMRGAHGVWLDPSVTRPK